MLKVLESWRAVLIGVRPGAFKLDVEECRVFARGDHGVVTCMEVIDNDDSIGRCVVGRMKAAWHAVTM